MVSIACQCTAVGHGVDGIVEVFGDARLRNLNLLFYAVWSSITATPTNKKPSGLRKNLKPEG